ncbi:conserved hypothetical protein [Francisella hispaniensis]|uniref:Uncharacterized protein n=1 Tax=Francisella hispaniensis TaxID=622488 RepID=F4BIJ6_9GAMM|nr:conserved hypothetical protein [Francisella hispaniensis]
MLLNIFSYLQPLLLLIFVYFLIRQKRVAWLFVTLAYAYPSLSEIIKLSQAVTVPVDYYLYAIPNALLYLAVAIWGLLASKSQQLVAIRQKNNYIKILSRTAIVLFIYLIINLIIALRFTIENFEAGAFLSALYMLDDIFTLLGLVLAILRYRICLLFLVVGFTLTGLINIYFIFSLPQYYLHSIANYYFLIITILTVIVLLYGYLKNNR